MTPLRRTGIQRRTELARTPLRRKKATAAVAAAKRTVAKQRTQAATRRRDTGPDAETKAMLWERAKGRCEICGRDVNGAPFSRHHRSPRRMGGSSQPWINQVTNLLLLCGTGTTGCHGAVEANRAQAIEAGWLVPLGYHPAEVPVLIRPSVSFHAVYLTETGEYAEGSI